MPIKENKDKMPRDKMVKANCLDNTLILKNQLFFNDRLLIAMKGTNQYLVDIYSKVNRST